MLPNLIIIGAAKAGTTSLNHYLGHHPEIHMSPVKEPSFFSDKPLPAGARAPGPWFRIGDPARYELLFETSAPVRGEASPSYSMSPIVERAAERIHAAVPGVKLIYLVRDPIERTTAHYLERFAAEGERRPLRRALGDPHDPRNPYVCPGRYASQLREYLRLFPVEQILVMDQADLLSRRRAALRGVFEFLGVDPTFDSPAFEEQRNVTSSKRARSPVYARLHRAVKEPVLERMPQFLRSGLAAVARPVLTRPVPAVGLDDDLRGELREIFASEVDDLRAMTGLRLATWSV
jgi:hypothetical protein